MLGELLQIPKLLLLRAFRGGFLQIRDTLGEIGDRSLQAEVNRYR
jgi:hypothetical protein